MVKLNVLYFAHVRARLGCDREILHAEAGATVSDVLDLLVLRHPQLEDHLPSVRVAVNGEFANLDQILPEEAEFVLIPPVAGGQGFPPVRISADVLDADVVTALEGFVCDEAYGALVSFAGRVRNHARGRAVTRLHYEAYESMALSELQKIRHEVEDAFKGTRVAIHHRVGTLEVGDVAVVVTVGSAHRQEAFDACARVITRLKEDVPIWKREVGPDGDEWVSDRP